MAPKKLGLAGRQSQLFLDILTTAQSGLHDVLTGGRIGWHLDTTTLVLVPAPPDHSTLQ
jgi:hypothetical protein